MLEVEIQALVQRARDGDASAFAALYEAFAPRVYRFFRFRVATAEAAEDLMQQVFVKVIEHLPNYRAQGVPFAAWLFRMARNAWIDEHRTARQSVPLEALAEQASVGADPEQMALASADWDRVRGALHVLSDDQREVVACRFFAGLSPRETAAQMGCSVGSVSVLQHRAMAALRVRLGTTGDGLEPGARRASR
jgi:RNA polymerase sigma-70 factor (ECF subfamily)